MLSLVMALFGCLCHMDIFMLWHFVAFLVYGTVSLCTLLSYLAVVDQIHFGFFLVNEQKCCYTKCFSRCFIYIKIRPERLSRPHKLLEYPHFNRNQIHETLLWLFWSVCMRWHASKLNASLFKVYPYSKIL